MLLKVQISEQIQEQTDSQNMWGQIHREFINAEGSLSIRISNNQE